MKRLILFFALSLTGCSSSNQLIFINSSSAPLTVRITPQTKNDTTTYYLNANSKDTITTDAFGSTSDIDRAELRTITVRNSTGKTLKIFRMSASYLSTQNWTLTYPFVLYDTSFLKKQIDPFKSQQTYHLAQDLYNANIYDPCILFCLSCMSIDAMYSHGNQGRLSNSEGFARYQGCLLMTYLSAKKTADSAAAKAAWHRIRTEIPHMARALHQYDAEFQDVLPNQRLKLTE